MAPDGLTRDTEESRDLSVAEFGRVDQAPDRLVALRTGELPVALRGGADRPDESEGDQVLGLRDLDDGRRQLVEPCDLRRKAPVRAVGAHRPITLRADLDRR